MIKKIFNEVVISLITNISGSTGRKLRYFYYRKKLKKCGTNVAIDEGVVISNPSNISIGNDVWIDKYSVIVAGKANTIGVIKVKKNKNYHSADGELIIGNGVHIGCFNIIQAHAGISIGDFVTTSAGVKIYSLSNYPYNEQNPSEITYANCLVGKDKKVSYIHSPIVIEQGVWIALNCIVVGGTIGKNSFIASNSIVVNDIPPNSIAKGNPAVRIKERFLDDKN